MRLIHSNGKRIIAMAEDGRILFLHDNALVMKRLPGLKKSAEKTYDFRDLGVFNAAMVEASQYLDENGLLEPMGLAILAEAMAAVFPPFTVVGIDEFAQMSEAMQDSLAGVRFEDESGSTL